MTTTTTIKQRPANSEATDFSIEQALAELYELKMTTLQAVEKAERALLASRREVEQTRAVRLEIEQYDEKEAAKVLKISYSKLVELREQKKFQQRGLVQRYGLAVRYSGEQLRRIQELMSGKD